MKEDAEDRAAVAAALEREREVRVKDLIKGDAILEGRG